MDNGNLIPSSVIWVSSTGDDRGDGSEGSPLATIQAAADRAEPGTAVLVKAGHYHENVEVKNSGTEDQPIWFVSADGPGQATIVPVNQYKATIVGRGTDNIVIRDFAIEGADHRNGIEFTQAGHDYHNWVDNLVIEGNHIYGSGIDGIKLAQARNVDVIGNIVSGGREEGVDLTTVMNTRIINNEIRDLDGRSGITAKGGSTNIEIKGNYIHDVGADAVIVGGWTDSDLLDELSLTYQASQVTVEGNRIENIEKRSINFLGGQDSVVKDNFFDPQNDYFTAVNVQVGRWGLVSKNNEISDNVITRENWLHVHSGNEQGLVTDGNVVGGTWAKPVGLDAYQPSPITWLRKDDDAYPTIEPSVEPIDSNDAITGWQLQRAFDNLSDAVIVQHDDTSKIDDGALAFSFNTNDPNKAQGIVSKDAAYFGTGGHISAWIENEKLVVRLQDENGSHIVETNNGAVKAGVDHQAVVSFGQDGMKLTFDDKLVDANAFKGGIQGNAEPWVFGASAIYSNDLAADKLTQPFDGTIGQVALFNEDDAVAEPEEAPTPVVPIVQAPVEETPTTGEPAENTPEESFDLIAGWQLQQAFDNLSDAVIVQHDDTSKIDDGALAFSFNTNDPNKAQGIVSKDAAYFGTGGHISAWIENEKLVVRLQDENGSHIVETNNGAVKAGVDHQAVVSFGQDGMKLTFDDKLVDANAFKGGIQGNAEPWVFGASAIYSNDLAADKLTQPFDGTIGQVALFNEDDAVAEPEEAPTPVVPIVQAPVEETPTTGEPAENTPEESFDLIAGWQLQQAFDNLSDAVIVQHDDTSKIDDGALAFSFNTNDPNKAQGIVSKDAAYFGTGGHISAWIENEKLVVRLQDENGSHIVETNNGAVKAGVDHQAVVSFGQDGMKLTFDDKLVDANAFKGGIQGNAEPWVFGASAIYSNDLAADKLTQPFDGTIGQVALFNEATENGRHAFDVDSTWHVFDEAQDEFMPISDA